VSAEKAPTLRPCRHIGLTTDGSNRLVIRVWGLGNIDFCGGSKAVPRDRVSSLLDSGRLPYDPGDVDALWRALNILRVTVPASKAIVDDPIARIINNLDALLADLPLAIHLARNPPFSSRPRLRLADAFEMLLAAVRFVDRVIVRNPPGRRGGATWHADAMWLCFLLRTAAYRLGHPEKVVLTSATGSGVKFIQAALRLALGMHLSGDAIVKAIRRYADGEIPGIATIADPQ
jgi:hypothetical protein